MADACQTGVDAEIADAALYDELKPSVDNADILRAFANLQASSLNNHLPAFVASLARAACASKRSQPCAPNLVKERLVK